MRIVLPVPQSPPPQQQPRQGVSLYQTRPSSYLLKFTPLRRASVPSCQPSRRPGNPNGECIPSPLVLSSRTSTTNIFHLDPNALYLSRITVPSEATHGKATPTASTEVTSDSDNDATYPTPSPTPRTKGPRELHSPTPRDLPLPAGRKTAHNAAGSATQPLPLVLLPALAVIQPEESELSLVSTYSIRYLSMGTSRPFFLFQPSRHSGALSLPTRITLGNRAIFFCATRVMSQPDGEW